MSADPFIFAPGGAAAPSSIDSPARRQEELCQSAELSALGIRVCGIAHDFNNLLTAVSGYLSMARMDSTEPKVQTSLAEVERAVWRAKHLARQILNFSQRQNDDRQMVRLPAAVAEALQLLRPTWPAGVAIAAHLPPDTGWVMACPTQIHQVLINLFVNAAHAMESGPGRLEVRVDQVVLNEPNPDFSADRVCGHYVRLTVSDTGHGMDAATRSRIFEPFFTTKRAGQGAGLGLAVVHRILKDHGARIQVSSEPGRGTTFWIYFAAQPAPG